MEPQVTSVAAPIQLRIADDLRISMETGRLLPGDSLPTLHDLCQQWACSLNSARAAIALLKQQGLITGGRGRAPTVRPTLQRVCHSSGLHQRAKDLVAAQRAGDTSQRAGDSSLRAGDTAPCGQELSPAERAGAALSAFHVGTARDRLDFHATYDVIKPDGSLAKLLRLDPHDDVLRRVYELRDARSTTRQAWSVSYLSHALVAANPALLDERAEPWPGGTQHQLSTVGVEVARIVDQVSATMPTTVEAKLWNLDDGVPMLRVRRISIDTTDRVVEVSDTDFPADRTELSFVTPLALW
jgi:GntR family transcriptional regulator